MPQVLCKDGTSRRTGTVPRGVSVPVGGAAQDARGRCASMHWSYHVRVSSRTSTQVRKFEKCILVTSRWFRADGSNSTGGQEQLWSLDLHGITDQRLQPQGDHSDKR